MKILEVDADGLEFYKRNFLETYKIAGVTARMAGRWKMAAQELKAACLKRDDDAIAEGIALILLIEAKEAEEYALLAKQGDDNE